MRLVCTRGVGALGVDPSSCREPRLFCIVDHIRLYDERQRTEGLDLVTVSVRRPAADVLDPRVKSLNYLNNVLAKREARLRGADEALVLNAQGHIAEASVANVFCVRGATLLHAARDRRRARGHHAAHRARARARARDPGRRAHARALRPVRVRGGVPHRQRRRARARAQPRRRADRRRRADLRADPPRIRRRPRQRWASHSSSARPEHDGRGAPCAGPKPSFPRCATTPPTPRPRATSCSCARATSASSMAGAYSLLPLGQRVVRKITGDRARGDGRDRRPGVQAARAASRGALEALGALGGDGRGDVPARRPQGRRRRARHDPRGGVRDARGRAAQLQGAAADLVPDPDQVPRRAAPEVGRAARARVHDEGLVLARPRLRPGSTRRSSDTSRRIGRSSARCGLETLAVEASSGSMGGSESIEFMVESDAGEDFVAACSRCGYAANVEKATSQLAGRRGRRRAARRRSASRRRACARSTTSPRSRAARRRSARSRRSSTRWTACSCSCCCAATTRSPSRSSSTRWRRARSGPRARRRSAPRWARAPGSLGAVGVDGPHRDRRLRARRPPRHGHGREPGRLPRARRRRRARHRGEALARPARGARGRGLPVVRRAAARREDDRGRPHLQARHALQRGARREGARRERRRAADHHGLVRDRHRARDGRGGRALSRRERDRVADVGGAVRGRRDAREAHRPRDRGGGRAGSTTRCARRASRCCSTTATSDPA